MALTRLQVTNLSNFYSTDLIASQLVSVVLDVVHDVVDTHLVGVTRPGVNRVVEVVDHDAARGQSVTGVHGDVAVGLHRVEALGEPKVIKISTLVWACLQNFF